MPAAASGAVGSPMGNRGMYKPPQMIKRPQAPPGQGAQAVAALKDVTNQANNVSVGGGTYAAKDGGGGGGDVKRLKLEDGAGG